jgi:uncharacterized protein (DUF1778 family)
VRQLAVLFYIGEVIILAHATQRERIEMRVDADIKQMAERASAALGCASLTEFITSLIRENAPEILQREASIQLTNAQFDRFTSICNDIERKPSARIIEASRRLDAEGF